MALLLAPYNDSMRIGQGYNSFLQSPCVYNATTKTQDTQATSLNIEPSQTVSYTSHVISKISDITRTMGVSTGSSIKNGSIALSGNASSIDELKFVDSDVNIALSVKVVNQTRNSLANDDMNFNTSAAQAIPNGDNQKFHEVFGDSYISGFVEGGDLHGIISIKILDSSRKEQIRAQIMGEINSSSLSSFTFDPSGYDSALAQQASSSETTIVVNWSGGGVVKPDDEEWSLEALYRAAAAFPAKVAVCPQRTWAILTPYENNPEFVQWALEHDIKPYDYSGVKSYASDLLDTYMGYKNNMRRIQSVLANPTGYVLGPARDPISISVKDLVLARKQMKAEMTKIMDEVDAINEHPDQFVNTIENPSMKYPELWADRLPVQSGLPASVVSELRQFALLDSDLSLQESSQEASTTISSGSLGQPFDAPASSLAPGITSLLDTEKSALNFGLNRRILANYRFDATPIAVPTSASGTTVSQNELRDQIRMKTVFSSKFKYPNAVRMRISTKQGLPVLEFAFIFGEEPTSSLGRAAGTGSVSLNLGTGEKINRVRVGKKLISGKEVISYVNVKTTGNQDKSVGEAPALQKDTIDFSPPPSCSGLVFLNSTATHIDTGAVGRLMLTWR
ncbi:hypothetical protein RSOLAG22IIIB_07735 [Rhizoctonia solani]|uniref:Uncharacterized protein n=1 Tax=Rhizoctonia solani TaxID=456999 RepID=A0A0K6FPA3_9AGAM|nr:hypothetical protein RSOLAG22IIIB_07735 [Rhizoctonia solani]